MSEYPKVWRDGKMVSVSDLPMSDRHFDNRNGSAYVMRDTPAYCSPVSNKVVDGRVARREDLKRTNCREVDPGEKPKPGQSRWDGK